MTMRYSAVMQPADTYGPDTAGPSNTLRNTGRYYAAPVPADYHAADIQHLAVNMNAMSVSNMSHGLDSASHVAVPGIVPVTYGHDGNLVYLAHGQHPQAYYMPSGYGVPPQRYAQPVVGRSMEHPSDLAVRRAYGHQDFTNYAHGQDNTGQQVVDGVPGLHPNRRSSYSTTESAPATPYYGSTASRDAGARVTVFDRSASSAYTTPSPEAVREGDIALDNDRYLYRGLGVTEWQRLIKQEPPIPAAVPAVFTPQENMKTLDQSLVNHIPGNRNVYIRGLHPTTDDETLRKYAERFGELESSKAIIDNNTGACKGFGFAKFKSVQSSQRCIQGFYIQGYEVGFARESFNSRLKAEGDETSTNLYISNLSKEVTEMSLAALFEGYTILSSKILRDNNGHSRGVGFARFESRDVCDQIIQTYTNVSFGQEGLAMQIRYADTPGQKELKRVTAERRQFRTNEYNVGAYGTPAVGLHPSIYQRLPRGTRGRMDNAFPLMDDTHQPGCSAHGSAGRGLTSSSASRITPPAEDDSGDEGVTVLALDSPVIADGSSRSSPTKQVKQEVV